MIFVLSKKQRKNSCPEYRRRMKRWQYKKELSIYLEKLLQLKSRKMS